MAEERLQKIIAAAGITSRRNAEQYILDGRVSVNGTVVNELGSKADPDRDEIRVEGFGKLSAQPKVYIALHKPVLVMSTVKDPEGRQTVLDVIESTRAQGHRQFEGALPRIFPVGRLDFNAEGLILLSNDGDLMHRLLHPRQHVPKTYAVKVRGRPDAKSLERLRNGVRLQNEDGSLTPKTLPSEVQITKQGPSNTWLEMTILEGRNHQVKRMCAAVGHTVSRLIRTDFGGISLDPLPPGAWRFLSAVEIAQLEGWSQQKVNVSKGRDKRNRH
ncbi:MAG: pseudouridine synthase [Myxococcota bacterium]|nr:pseudouridine synthase [Myxococcota bacterium]